MRRALRDELAWRDAVVRRLQQPAAASDDFTRQLEQQRKPLGRRAFLFRLMGTPANLTQAEFVASLEKTAGSSPAVTAAPRLRSGMRLQDELAARAAAVAAVEAQTRQPTTAKLRPGMSLRTELAVRDALVASVGGQVTGRAIGGRNSAKARGGRMEFRRKGLTRGVAHGGGGIAVQLRSSRRGGSSSDIPVLEGYGAVFDTWTEIDSLWEGRFMEQIASGAFKKTLQENASRIRCLFQHGRDPVVGDKPLGDFETLEEDAIGLHYVVPMLDTSYNADLIPGLRAGVYGASFMFDCIKDEVDYDPPASAWNPSALPQRTLQELRLFELGPVTFGAYESATAGIGGGNVSLTDDFLPPEATNGTAA